VCACMQGGRCQLLSVDTATLACTVRPTPYSEVGSVRARPGRVVFVAGSPKTAPAVGKRDIASGRYDVLRPSSDIPADAGYVALPEAIEFPTASGLTAHAHYYPPYNRGYSAPAGEKPPLLVMSHGGPTAAASTVLNWGRQYFTSRGFAVVDVDYGGSTGYGRAYRQRLNGQWGVVDVEDCANAARYLVAEGKVDGTRLAIRGGSAGGYTTLCALTFRDLFQAGASYYGISDLEALVRDTHKFESRYLDHLIGPYPESRELYYQRSPIHFVDRLSCPLILFQGLEDKVVAPNQTELMQRALRAKGLPVAYVTYEGEQHGFRRAESIRHSLESELYFYSRVFRFPLAEAVSPVLIENLIDR